MKKTVLPSSLSLEEKPPTRPQHEIKILLRNTKDQNLYPLLFLLRNEYLPKSHLLAKRTPACLRFLSCFEIVHASPALAHMLHFI